MLLVRNIEKIFMAEDGPRRLYHDLSFDFHESGRLAILGRNGQGKSTLIKILGGVLMPTHGSVKWSMSVSWPLGFGGAFQHALSGLDNIRFIARIYNKPIPYMIEMVEDFAQLGKQLSEPIKFYSSGMRARLAFGLSLAIEFDCYLIDEIIAVGDQGFQERCQQELFDKRQHRAFIIASHNLQLLRQLCTRAIIVEGGYAKVFDDMELAADTYMRICDQGLTLAPSQ